MFKRECKIKLLFYIRLNENENYFLFYECLNENVSHNTSPTGRCIQGTPRVGLRPLYPSSHFFPE